MLMHSAGMLVTLCDTQRTLKVKVLLTSIVTAILGSIQYMQDVLLLACSQLRNACCH
jgi:hypothetical protein